MEMMVGSPYHGRGGYLDAHFSAGIAQNTEMGWLPSAPIGD